MNVWLTMLNVPERATPVLEEAENDTVPEPLPDDPEVIVSHEAFELLDQIQPLGAVTFVEPLLPA